MTSDLRGHMLATAGTSRSSSIHTKYSSSTLFLQESLSHSVKVALPPLYPSSPRAHSFKFVTRAPATASLRRVSKHQHGRQDVSLPPNQETSCVHHLLQQPACSASSSTSMTSFHNHASSCILAADGKVGATIWHALLPARHLADHSLDCTLSRASLDPAGMMIQSSDSSSVGSPSKLTRSGVLSVDGVGLPRLGSLNATAAMVGGLCEGSWNAAWDARPARWLHGRHSAWLLFGVCACFSAAAVPLITAASSPVLTDAVVDSLPPPATKTSTTTSTTAATLAEVVESEPVVSTPVIEQSPGHGKEIITDYTVTGVPGDGRCLFRAVAHGSCLRSGKDAPDETEQRELADELRGKVADELIKRRESTEWFIEGDFDQYVERMRQTYVWGGEPELIMLSHVLEMPITVYMIEEKTKAGLIAIAEYGQGHITKSTDPIRVLYHGFGHYEALQIPSNKAVASKL